MRWRGTAGGQRAPEQPSTGSFPRLDLVFIHPLRLQWGALFKLKPEEEQLSPSE